VTPLPNEVKILEEQTKDSRIKKEVKRLSGIYRDLDKNTRASLESLIKRAAYMRITLEDYEKDLDEKGYIEQFSQSKDLAPYERERPVARLYNAMNKNYQSIMKQLSDSLPDALPPDVSDSIMKFAFGKKK
jgi:predicted transcriptional regulator